MSRRKTKLRRVQAEINGDARVQADYDLNEIPQDEGRPPP